MRLTSNKITRYFTSNHDRKLKDSNWGTNGSTELPEANTNYSPIFSPRPVGDPAGQKEHPQAPSHGEPKQAYQVAVQSLHHQEILAFDWTVNYLRRHPLECVTEVGLRMNLVQQAGYPVVSLCSCL